MNIEEGPSGKLEKLSGQEIIDKIQEIIENSAEAIENEYKKTSNPWLNCFGTQVFTLETYNALLKNTNTKQNNQELIEEIKLRIQELTKQYSSKENIPPKEIQEELFSMLDKLISIE